MDAIPYRFCMNNSRQVDIPLKSINQSSDINNIDIYKIYWTFSKAAI